MSEISLEKNVAFSFTIHCTGALSGKYRNGQMPKTQDKPSLKVGKDI